MSVYTTLMRVAQIMKINMRTAIVINRNAGVVRAVHQIPEALFALTVCIHEAFTG